MDIEKLAKLMMRTTSSNDHESLASIRMANGLLDASNLTWNDFIAQKTIVIQEIVQQTAKPKDADIEKMLSECLVNIRSPTGLDFIKSLNNFYKTRGYLTPKQKEALTRWYNNL